MQSRNLNLYNKYRPKTFSQFIGQDIVKLLIIKTLQKTERVQSFLFSGPSGVGKTSLARIFAKACSCEKFKQLGDVCNECEFCRHIEEGTTTDFAEIDAASYSGVDHVREINLSVRYVPFDLKKKVYIFDECHNFSSSAWNALLKTIEEPSDDVVFIFLTTNILKIPETIQTRCQKYYFTKLNEQQIYQLIDYVCEGENKTLDSDSKQLIHSLCGGSARECVSHLEQLFIDSSDSNISILETKKIFSISDRDDVVSFFNLLSDENVSGLIQKTHEIIEVGKNILHYFSSILSICIELSIYKLSSESKYLKILTESEATNFLSKDIDYLFMADTIETFLSRFNESSQKNEWAKILSLTLLNSLHQKLELKAYEEIKGYESIAPLEKNKNVSLKQDTTSIINKQPDKSKPTVQSLETTLPQNISKPTPQKPQHSSNFTETFTKIADLDDIMNKVMEILETSKIDNSTSEKNYITYKKFINSEKTDEKFLDLFKKAYFSKNLTNQKQMLITTNNYMIFLFEDEPSAKYFNDFLLNNEKALVTLNTVFFKKRDWLGISKENFRYCMKNFKNRKIMEEPKKQKKDSDWETSRNKFLKIVGIINS